MRNLLFLRNLHKCNIQFNFDKKVLKIHETYFKKKIQQLVKKNPKSKIFFQKILTNWVESSIILIVACLILINFNASLTVTEKECTC